MENNPSPKSAHEAESHSVIKRLGKETTRGLGVLRHIIDAGRRILELRPKYRLASEIFRYRRAMAKLGWSPKALARINLLFGLIPIVGRNASLVDLRPEHIKRLLESRSINRKTANLYRNDIAAFLTWWSLDRKVRFNPALLVDLKQLVYRLAMPPRGPVGRRGTKRLARHKKNRQRRLTNREIRRLLYVTIRFRPDALVILLLSLFLGLRPEVEALPRWEHFDRDHATWKILKSATKTGVARTVVIPPFLMAWLLLLRRDKGPVAPWGYANWKKNVRPQIFKRAKAHFHKDCLRVTCISNFAIFCGLDLKLVAKRLGNSELVIKATYLSPPTPPEAAAFMAMFPPDGWAPRLDYRPHQVQWPDLPATEVMVTVPSLRQWISFMRGEPTSVSSLLKAA